MGGGGGEDGGRGGAEGTEVMIVEGTVGGVELPLRSVPDVDTSYIVPGERPGSVQLLAQVKISGLPPPTGVSVML